ncbi:type 2 periplasmic-binding domain-containing protein [Agrobacterium tumefaciens]|uniref:hypothetical protein n=1 Tax=Agrobacterium tumefaciens TaxID=358 RepID=UPI001B8A1F7A|nr:hypothetical protein [Agrobacterium tumefaciens]
MIETFSTLNPEVEIELLTGAYVLGLAQREADVSFRIHPFAEDDIVQRRLIDMRCSLYLAKGMNSRTEWTMALRWSQYIARRISSYRLVQAEACRYRGHIEVEERKRSGPDELLGFRDCRANAICRRPTGKSCVY